MDLFANVGNTQKSMDYSQVKQTDNIPTRKLEETANTQKDKQDEEVKKHQKELTKEQLQDLTQQLNKEMAPLNPDIKFSFNDKINELVVNVVDKNTDKVIRKIPSEEALKIMEKMRELVGALFDDKG
jgi:flagellar protein FlaG